MLEKIKKWIRDHIFNYYERCYTIREYEGIAAMRCCCGVVGGDKTTEYLSPSCIGCPYLELVEKNE